MIPGPGIGARPDGADAERWLDSSDALVAWVAEMPKAELHLHLDGSLRPGTALELARERAGLLSRSGIDAADLLLDQAAMRARLVAPARCADQAELLRSFDLPVALLQDAEALTRVAEELVEDVATDGTRYVEIRWAPGLHTRAGLSLHQGIAAVVRGATRGSHRTGSHVRLIAVAMRTQEADLASAVARTALDFLPDGVVGFDLAGREADAPDPAPFAAAFDAARRGGLGLTCHAGEWGGPEQVRRALALGAWRIAHGAPAVQDEALLATLRARRVTLDLCPTSNVQAGVVPDLAAHPLARLARAGVPVTLSTDDRTVSDLTLVREYLRAVAHVGLRPVELAAVARHAYEAAFLHHDEELRTELLAAFDAWLEGRPPPAPDGHAASGE